MPRRAIQREGAEQVPWAHELNFLVPRQVGKIEIPELAEVNRHPDALVVVRRVVLLALFRRGTQRIGRGAHAGHRHRRQIAGGGDDVHVQAGDGNLRSRFGNRDVHLRADGKIRVETGGTVACQFVGERTGIVDAPDRHLVGERGDAADVITVVMADHHVVDAIDARILHRGHDSIRITTRRIRQIAGIDQQRLPRAENPVAGRHDQDGLSTLGVDEVDLSYARRLSRFSHLWRCLRLAVGHRSQHRRHCHRER